MGVSKKKKKVVWGAPLLSFLKFNVDGTTQGKARKLGIGVFKDITRGKSYIYFQNILGLKLLMKQKFWPF